MVKNTEYKSDNLCITIFTLCLAARFVIGKRLLCRFVLVGINNFSTARKPCTFRNIYQ